MDKQTAGGGTFFRFSIGRQGTAAAHLGYISRESAVLDREQGVLTYQLPEYVLQGVTGYSSLRESLIAYAWTCEALLPQSSWRQAGKPRTHYRALFSFERTLPARQMLNLVECWLKTALPEARAIGFLHQNTEHPHVHLFIAAQDRHSNRLAFPHPIYRHLDEVWNRLYAPTMEHSERDHLDKKQQRKLRRHLGVERGYNHRETRNRNSHAVLSQEKPGYVSKMLDRLRLSVAELSGYSLNQPQEAKLPERWDLDRDL